MTPNEYQKLAARTLVASPPEVTDSQLMILWNTVGISGEAGELLDYIKKVIFHKHQGTRDKIVEELGDILCYISGLCTVLDISLEEVMTRNIDKLQ